MNISSNEQDFREEVIAKLSTISAKMDMLVGTDTNKGRVRKLEEDVQELKSSRDKAIGWGIAWGMFIGIGEAIYHLFKK